MDTLSPGLPASAEYDPVTGILHLGIPRGDAGDAAIATPISLGSVKPQTGDNDGLELGEDGTLRVRAASTTQRGSVLASEMAQAGATPVGGADGSLEEGWLKKAMEAASTAQTTADEALEAAGGSGKVTLKGTRTTTGDWTFTSVAVGKPLFILAEKDAGVSFVQLATISGGNGGTTAETIGATGGFFMGWGQSYAASDTFVVIPTSTTVVVKVIYLSSITLKAYQ